MKKKKLMLTKAIVTITETRGGTLEIELDLFPPAEPESRHAAGDFAMHALGLAMKDLGGKSTMKVVG